MQKKPQHFDGKSFFRTVRCTTCDLKVGSQVSNKEFSVLPCEMLSLELPGTLFLCLRGKNIWEEQNSTIGPMDSGSQ